jgi:predicted secreted protein
MNEVVRKRLREEFDRGKPDDSADEVDTVTNSSVTGDKVQQQAKKKPKRRGGR